MGQMNAAKSAEAAAKTNQKLHEARARNAENEARENMGRKRSEALSQMSALRARAAAGGGGLTGSSLDFLDKSASRLELQVLDMGRQASVAAMSERHSGAMSLWEGKQHASGMRSRAFGTLLTGVGNSIESGRRTGFLS